MRKEWSKRTSLENPASLAGIGVVFLLACATGSDRPLPSRGIPIENRYEIVNERPETPPDIAKSYMEGEVVRGMSRDWVLDLYGRPDRAAGPTWEYHDRKGKLLAKILFLEDKVDSVYKDLN